MTNNVQRFKLTVSHKVDVADSTFASLYWSDVTAPPFKSTYAGKRKEISAFNTMSSSQNEGNLPDANVCSKFETKCHNRLRTAKSLSK